MPSMERGEERGREGRVPRPALAWLPDALTHARLLALPVLWALALLRMPSTLAIAAAVAAFTDVLDGFLARRLGVASKKGGALDSIADHLLSISLVTWLFMLRPGFFREEWPVLMSWAVFALTVLAVGWVRYRQPVNLHLYSAKAAVFACYCLALWILGTGSYSRLLFDSIIGLAWVGSGESLLMILTHRRPPDDHRGSILLPRRG
jgi:phosphatidylglycerophosphate synthase